MVIRVAIAPIAVILALTIAAQPAGALNCIDGSDHFHPLIAQNDPPDAPDAPIVEEPSSGAVDQPQPAASAYHIAMLILTPITIIFLIRTRALRLPPVPRIDTMLAILPILFFCGLLIAQPVGGAIAWNFLPEDLQNPDAASNSLHAQSVIRIGMYMLAVVVILTFLYTMQRVRSTSPGAARSDTISIRGPLTLPDRAPRRASFLGSIFVGLGALVLFWPIVHTTSWLGAIAVEYTTGESPPTLAHTTLDALTTQTSSPWTWVMIMLVVIGAPLFEEFGYRGMFQRGLRDAVRVRWVAIMITSVMFVAMHIGAVAPHALAGLFVLSIGFGWVYERTGNLASSITMHAGFNTLNIWLAFVAV